MPQTRTESTDAERFRIRDRLTELIDAAVQANDSEEGPDAQAAAESIMSEFDVRHLRPFATGGVLRGEDITGPNVSPVAAEPAARHTLRGATISRPQV